MAGSWRSWLVVPVVSVVLAGCAPPPRPTIAASIAQAPLPLVGTTAASLESRLGAPALRRIDGSAQVWLYGSKLCRMNVILYPGTAGDPQVSSAMSLTRGISRASCMASLEQTSLEQNRTS